LLSEVIFPTAAWANIEAIASFLEPGGDHHAIITNPPNLGRAPSSATGTHVVPG
jgi:hypothetical protein